MATKKSPTKKAPAPAKKAAPRKAAPKKKATAKKATSNAAVKQSTTSATQGTAGRRRTIPPDATVLVTDEEYAREFSEQLAEKFPPEVIMEELQEILGATIESKSGNKYVDGKTRLAAIQMIVHQKVGTPIKRSEHTETKVMEFDEVGEMLKHSKALRDYLRKLLAQYDEKDGVTG